jgi:hypothetical protein
MENLKHSEIWLSSPNSFNDPYDCRLTYNSKKLLDYYFVTGTIKTFSNVSGEGNNQILSFNTIPTYEETMGKYYPSIKPDDKNTNDILNKTYSSFDNWITLISNKINNSVIISCFSEIIESIRMWSLYADKHKGFCLEYDFKSLPKTDQITKALYPVKYQKELFDITEFMVNTSENNNFYQFRAAITKSIEWDYEKEWRMMFHTESSLEGMQLAVPLPSAIYAGAKIENENMAFLKTYAEAHNIYLNQAKLSNKNFEMSF